MRKKNSYLLMLMIAALIIIHPARLSGQLTKADTSHRKTITLGVIGIGAGSSYFLLNELWYKDFPRSSFHVFNDNSEWLQMDKIGHGFSTYTLARMSHEVLLWSGMNENQSTWIGGTLGLAYLTGVELLDAKSSAWGFSYGDMIANSCGSFLFITQQKIWKEQRIKMKFSYFPSQFSVLNPDALGRNFQQRIFKDYNAQTYWSSFNIHSFLASDAVFPRWLNVAFGYGATEMLHAKDDVHDVNNFQRKREFYFSFDADLERVQWNKKWMKRMMKILSFIKIPGPTLEIRSDENVKMHAVFF